MAKKKLTSGHAASKRTYMMITDAASTSDQAVPLFSLGYLHPKVLVSRPSKTIKTPYVADVTIKTSVTIDLVSEFHKMQSIVTSTTSPAAKTSMSTSAEGTPVVAKSPQRYSKKQKTEAVKSLSEALQAASSPESLTLAHTPSLDCAGMIVPGATVLCSENLPPGKTKTAYTVQLCEELREDGDYVTVGCHPQLAERAAKHLLESPVQPLQSELGKYDPSSILSQQTFGHSRVDYVLQGDDNTLTLLEVKNVVGADYPADAVPAGRCEVGVYPVNAQGYQRHAIFPHGSHKPGVGVVSDRAIKHVHELTLLHGSKDVNTGKILRCAVLFVVNRSDCVAFRPCHEADLLFAQVLKRAMAAGVTLIAKEIVWKPDSESSDSWAAYAGRTLPVVFASEVSAQDIDEDHLQQVLQFNEDGSGRGVTSPSPLARKVASPVKRTQDGKSSTAKELKTTITKKKRKSTTSDDE